MYFITCSCVYAWGPGVEASYDASWPTPFRAWSMWRHAAEYFPHLQLHKTCDLSPNKAYIFGYHPHGILAFGGWFTFGTNVLGFENKFPGIDVRVLTININFRAPFLREYLLLHGVCSVSKTAILRMLGKGKSVFIALGGGSESLLASPGKYDLILKRRRGFIRCAVQTGASLVPVLGFGEPDTYSTISRLPHSSPIRQFQRYLERSLGFTLPLAFGAGVILPVGLCPYPVPIDVVIGSEIPVEKYQGDPCGAEFDAVVDKYHRMYCQELQKLFNQHKEKFAKGASDLQLVE